MTERTIAGSSFRETSTNTNAPARDNSKAPYPRLQSTSPVCKVVVKFDVSGLRRQTVDSATLRVRTKTLAAQTWTVTPLNERKALRNINSSTLGSLSLRTGQAFTVAVPATADGDYVEIPVAAFLQTVADGAENYGLLISTNSTADNRIYGTESEYKNDSWQLVYSTQEQPDPPTDLSPNGGLVSLAKPVLSSAFRDPGGESRTLAALKVEVGHMSSLTFVSDWASGSVAPGEGGAPSLDLSTTSYPGASGTVFWRMAHMDESGLWSDWSDIAEWTTLTKPAIEVTNLTGGVVYDVTPTFEVTSDGDIQRWRLQIFNSDKTRELYDSRQQNGEGLSEFAHEVPFRDPDTRKRVIRNGSDYWARIRVLDDEDRIATPGDPIWTELWLQFHVDSDAAVTVPTNLTVSQVGSTPVVRLAWKIAEGYAEGFVVKMADDFVARLDLDDVSWDGDQFVYEFFGCPPYKARKFTVAAVAGGNASRDSAPATIRTEVEEFWISGHGYSVSLLGVDVAGFASQDKVTTYELLNAPYNVQMVRSLGGVAGTFAGTLGSTNGRDFKADHDALMKFCDHPECDVTVTFGTIAITANVLVSEPLPYPGKASEGGFHAGNMKHAVSVVVQQVEDFD